MITILKSIRIRVHLKYNGLQQLNGLVVLNNSQSVPNCEVKLFDKNQNKYIGTSLTNIKGEYLFNNLNLNNFEYFIIAHDPSKKFNGVIADNIGGENVDD